MGCVQRRGVAVSQTIGRNGRAQSLHLQVAQRGEVLYIERPSYIIDTDIVRDNGAYFRFTKDEATKSISMDSSAKLMGPRANVNKFLLTRLKGHEFTECSPLKPTAAGGKAT